MAKPDTPAKTAPDDAKPAKALSAAEAAARVRRLVTEQVEVKGEDGQPVTVERVKRVKVSAAEVLDFRDYGTHVVVVTRDGQKLSSADTGADAGAE